jgi:hypothetical protein
VGASSGRLFHAFLQLLTPRGICLRFRKLDDLALDLLAQPAGGVTPEELIARYEATRAAGRGKKPNAREVRKAAKQRAPAAKQKSPAKKTASVRKQRAG